MLSPVCPSDGFTVLNYLFSTLVYKWMSALCNLLLCSCRVQRLVKACLCAKTSCMQLMKMTVRQMELATAFSWMKTVTCLKAAVTTVISHFVCWFKPNFCLFFIHQLNAGSLFCYAHCYETVRRCIYVVQHLHKMDLCNLLSDITSISMVCLYQNKADVLLPVLLAWEK